MPEVSSRLPQPSRGRVIPRIVAVHSYNTRRSMSLPDISRAGAPPAQTIRRNVPSRAAPVTTAKPIRAATSTLALNRKRPATTTTANHGGKRPVVQSAATKPTVTTSALSNRALQPANATTGKRKVPAWDTKGQLEIANDKIERLQQEKENLENAAEEVKRLRQLLQNTEEKLFQTQRELTNALEKLKSCENLEAQNADLRIEVQKLVELTTKYTEEILKLTTDLDKLKGKLKESDMTILRVEEELNKEKMLCENWTMKYTQLQDNYTEALNRIFELETVRRNHLNQILDLKGNVRVFCRIRPSLPTEIEKSTCNFVYPDEGTVLITHMQDSAAVPYSSQKNKSDKSFVYDRVFTPSCTQEDIYVELSQLVQSVLDGYNVCIFAYGQTGSGKTYTMEGGSTPEQEGMIPRTVRTIFNSIKEQDKLGWKFTVKCSFLEIYNEVIKDLLNPNSNASYEIKMADSNSDDVVVSNLKVEVICNENELKKFLGQAQRNRSVAATVMNKNSSRSHSITQIRVQGFNESRKSECLGTLNLIDLAGSEKYRIENESGRRLETCNINKSLASLSHVVLKLAEKSEHIPFRDSKLTHLLMPSLKGNSKTLMLVNISPFEDCLNETESSLRFASRVASVKLNARRQVRSVSNSTKKCK